MLGMLQLPRRGCTTSTASHIDTALAAPPASHLPHSSISVRRGCTTTAQSIDAALAGSIRDVISRPADSRPTGCLPDPSSFWAGVVQSIRRIRTSTSTHINTALAAPSFEPGWLRDSISCWGDLPPIPSLPDRSSLPRPRCTISIPIHTDSELAAMKEGTWLGPHGTVVEI